MARAAFRRQQGDADGPGDAPGGRGRGARPTEEREPCGPLRCLFGNPFRRVRFPPTWRTDAAVTLAQGMYESRDFAPMPVRADALEDAGGVDPEVRAHGRGRGPPARGCWVVDLVPGKE